MNTEAERMIEVFTDWLNKHHEANDDDYRITRNDYTSDISLGDTHFHDEPLILADVLIDEGFHLAQRIIILHADPYHDEGGPNRLTGFFSHDDGYRVDTLHEDHEQPRWILDAMVQYFDTMHQMIFTDGHYAPASLPAGDEVTAEETTREETTTC
jgi:hypothetical protein